MSDIAMPEVRAVYDDGRPEKIVQTLGALLRKGNEHYYAPAHKGHLKCLCCEADVFFRSGSVSIQAGNQKGRVDHFVVNGKHEEHCIIPMRAHNQNEAEIDRNLGYLLKLNTLNFSETFNGLNKEFPTSKGMEVFVVHSAQDIIRFIRNAEPERLAKSRIRFLEEERPWGKFLIRYAREGQERRFLDLWKELKDLPQGAQQPFVAMELRLSKPQVIYPLGNGQEPARSKGIPAGVSENGLPVFIVPSAFVSDVRDPGAMSSFNRAGDYLVLGSVRLNRKEYDNRITYYLNILVEDSRQAEQVDISDISRKMQRKSELRAMKSMTVSEVPPP